MTKPYLTRDELMAFLSYNPATGVFKWKEPRRFGGRVFPVGSVAGGDNGQGYQRIKIRGRFYKSHRLAWLFIHGHWPANHIDHINGDRFDNRLVNLREALPGENVCNMSHLRKNNTSGYRGVSALPNGKWSAHIRTGGRLIHLGTFEEKRDASHSYEVAARVYFGAFARPRE